MKKPIGALALLIFCSISNAATLTLVNRYGGEVLGRPLFVTVTAGLENIPNFSASFPLLGWDSTRQTSVVNISGMTGCNPPPYGNPPIRISIRTINDNNAYFGVGFACSKSGVSTDSVTISGFKSSGIAYSWETGVNAKVYFCSAEDYQKHGGCNW